MVENAKNVFLNLLNKPEDLKKNDLVWCSAVTFISTISCAIHLNSKFDLIDINLEEYNIDISIL